MADKNDSHISKPDPHAQPPGPTRQHHRMALGEKISGTDNPNGSAPATQSKIAGQKKTW